MKHSDPGKNWNPDNLRLERKRGGETGDFRAEERKGGVDGWDGE